MKVVALLPVVIFDVARALAQAPLDPAGAQVEIAELLVAYHQGALSSTSRQDLRPR